MHSDRLAVSKFKRVCADFPNLALLAKSAKSEEFQVIYAHTSNGNKFLGETVTTYAMAGLLEAPTVATIDSDYAFTFACDKIRLPTTKVLLCTAAADLYMSKRLCDWANFNAVLFPAFLTKVVILKVERATEKLLDIFYANISELDQNPPSRNQRSTAQVGPSRRTPRTPRTM